MAENGSIKTIEVEGRPSIYVYECLSGVIAHITPISLVTLRAIQLKGEDKYPYPDTKLYEIKENPETSFDPNQVLPATKNPEYLKLCEEIDSQRKGWSNRAVFDYAVQFPKYPTQSDLIAAFRPQLDQLREIASIDMDDYDTVLFHIVMSWNQPARSESGSLYSTENEYGRIINLAIQTVALSPVEVANGIRFFRPQIRQPAP